MKTLNTLGALTTTAPAQDITASGATPADNSNLVKLGMRWRDFAVVLEDARGATQSFEDVELEVYGYINNTSKPMLIYSGSESSDTGTLMVPIENMPDVQYIYALQATHDNLIGPAAVATVTSTNSGPFDFVASGKTIVISIDGAADDTATFDAAAAALTSGNAETYAVTAGETLLFEIDNGAEQTVTISATNATATAVEIAAECATLTGCTVSGATGSVVVTSDTIGTDSHVKCNGGTANTALAFSTTIEDGTGDVGDVTAVTGTEIKTIVEADVSDCDVTVNADGTLTFANGTNTGIAASIQVNSTSTADTIIGVDNVEHVGPTDANPACNYYFARGEKTV